MWLFNIAPRTFHARCQILQCVFWQFHNQYTQVGLYMIIGGHNQHNKYITTGVMVMGHNPFQAESLSWRRILKHEKPRKNIYSLPKKANEISSFIPFHWKSWYHKRIQYTVHVHLPLGKDTVPITACGIFTVFSSFSKYIPKCVIDLVKRRRKHSAVNAGKWYKTQKGCHSIKYWSLYMHSILQQKLYNAAGTFLWV